MHVKLSGDFSTLQEGLLLIAGRLGVQVLSKPEDEELPLRWERHKGQLEAEWDGKQGTIRYDERHHGFRAFGLWVEKMRACRTDEGQYAPFHVQETPQFTTVGVMFDASRNAVPSLPALHEAFITLALMGMNQVMLYTEDTYEVEAYPYFGYMRGRYTNGELKQIDDWAADLGIEVVPCIQTLAHLEEALKWEFAAPIKDTGDILLVGEEKTYAFIESMIEAASAPFRSRRIHIGMDEAHQLGLGNYLKRNGFRNRFDIMNEHLHRVVEIAERRGLIPMIWSDMYFRLGSRTGHYYDLEAEIPQEAVQGIPQGVTFVYWDYYHDQQQFYEAFIQEHFDLGRPVVFAGGIWTWNGIAPNTGKMRATTEPALMACKSLGVPEVVATMWGDNGAETPWMSAWLGLQLYAEHAYAKQVDEQRLQERFALCVGGDLHDFQALGQFDETPGVAQGNPQTSNPSKFLLWQDVLIGLFDANIKDVPLAHHYQRLAKRLSNADTRNSAFRPMFRWYTALAEVLAAKCDLGVRLKTAYDQCQHRKSESGTAGYEETLQQLNTIADELVLLRASIDSLRRLHREVWFAAFKPFGWEVMDMRYGGLLARLDTAFDRIRQYTAGDVESLPELDAERLPFDSEFGYRNGTLGRAAYHSIVSAGSLFKPV
ncbi:beta-N-acetylhexosaminidase [Paenibacillus sp. GD4]|jgi:hexosaminidase|uniref:beta-N-acetylhexosaminidase n=1 Tax=Paenibacillus sp. GD4 TaxID=3068890 RepID=UPI002796D572|nr:beta-N-acetylhexosaminidase [Paenibacillus sp. GD4]MDQ1914766.1 beta-N-acetylhexosaminidase [Paenibacillus sp. GD4]